MPRVPARIVGGGLLIALGVLILLEQLGIFTAGVSLLLAVVLGAVGVYFLGVFFSAPSARWWAVLPGVIFLDLAVLMVLGMVSPTLACTPNLGGWVLSCSELAGVVFLGGLGLSFWAVYAASRSQWWAVIPAGVLTTLALVTLASSGSNGGVAGGVFFLGLGATFLLVGLLPTPGQRMGWAFIPAGIFFATGIILIAALTEFSGVFWGLALMALGVWLLLRARRRL
jgi:hypothetical protein